MGHDNQYGGIDAYAVRLIKYKARQLIGQAGFTPSDREDIEQELIFDLDIRVYNPYLASEMPEAIGVVKTSLDNLLSESNVIVCLAPLTLGTKGMIGQRELDMIPSDSVFVNVSRGAVVNSDALIARRKRGDIVRGWTCSIRSRFRPTVRSLGSPTPSRART